MHQRRTSLIMVFLALTATLVACGRAPAPGAALEYTAEATSATSVRVVFSAAVDDASTVAANYAIAHAGGPVQVYTAQRAADGRTVVLGTARLQDGVTYTLDVRGVAAAQGGAIGTSASSFGGTSVNAPIVASAIALGPTEVLVHFADPPPGAGAEMSDMALDPRYYDVVEEAPTLDETPDLTIVSIRFAVDDRGRTDRTRIVLTTEPQTDTGYTLRVTNVLTQAGDKVLDPTNSSAAFRGIPVDDADGPTVAGATATSNTQVLVDFSEPVVGADRADRYTIVAADGSALEVIAATYANPYQTQVLLTTAPQRDERTLYTVTVTGVTDRQGNAIDAAANSADFHGVFRTGPIDGDTTAPRVANTGSTGNTTVLVTFTEPVEQTSAEDPAHYRISARLDGAVGPQSTLRVLSAVRSADRTTVALTTMAQSDLFYTLAVTNVKDLAGNQIAPPELLNDPSTVTFQGTPPSGPQSDTDGDGLSDVAEQAGWFVSVRNADGSVRRYEVTSDPGDPDLAADHADNVASRDTDDDRLSDLDERIYGTDPRSADTDGDGIDDWTELNVYYTEPTQQDTDGDGLVDGLETGFFGTSALLADTDGDQIDDGDEVGLQNRNPLIADLPTFDLRVVGDVQLGLDVRYTAESASGSRVLETRSSESTLTTESSRTSGSENANATEWFINAGVKAGLEYEPPVSFTFTGEVSVDGGYKEASTTSFSSSSVQSTQQAQAASLGTERELQAGETVTREVVGASMAVSLMLVSLGDVAFTVENLEVTAKLVDPRDPTRFIPIATLTSADGASFNLGPAPDARGPIRFVAADPAPALIEALRENPRNLLFEVANYDVVAEGGRNFTFTYQDVNDRTATFTFDYGGRRAAERYRVATPSTFDETGDPIGPALFELLENVLDLEYLDDAADAALIAECAAGTCTGDQRLRYVNSYSTRVDAATGEVAIHRIRNVVANAAGFRWFVEVELPLTSAAPDDVRDAPITSGRSVRFLYGQDSDGDGLTVQVEAFYGSVDAPTDVLNNACFGDPLATGCATPDGIPDSRDTDRDGVPDDEEIFGASFGGGYDPWLVVVRGEDAAPTSSSPARYDTDGDGLTDCQELGRCPIYVYVYPNATSANPGAAQTTLRAQLMADPQGGLVAGLFRDATGRPGVVPGVAAAWVLELDDDPYDAEARTDPSRVDSDRDGLSDAAELVGVRYRPLDAQVGDLPRQLHPGYGAARFVALTAKATDPLNADSDFDLLGDGAEVQIGIDPTDPNSTGDAALDTDGDGLRNIEERFGWVVVRRDAAGVWRDANGALLHQNAAGRLLAANATASLLDDLPIPLDDLGNPVSTVDVRLADGLSAPARVPSDPDRADADADGLTDGEERALFSHPGRFDTDGDGLGDGAEARGVDFPSDPVDPARFTNPLAFDSDADGRSDGDEVLTSWVVAVRGATPYRVFSDPLIADEDLDGLGDGAELLNGTDPDDADTDGDGVQDGTELASAYDRDPRVADQVVEFRYANATILDSCYLIGGEASLEGWGIATNGWFADLRYSAFGGNPDGYLWLRAGDFFFGGTTNFLTLSAPAAFAGDRSAFYGGTFSFDLREFQREGDQTRFDPNLRLVGGGLTLEYDADLHESTTWTTVSIPLTAAEAGWLKVGTTDAPTEAEFRTALTGLTAIQIRGGYEAPQRFFDFLYGGVGFDNPELAASGQTTIANDFDDGALAAGNFRGLLNLEVPGDDGALDIYEGVVNLRDDLSGVSSGATVPLTSQVRTFVLGRDQSFRAFSNNILEESEAYTLGIDANAVADYGSLSNRYTYPVVGGNDALTLRGELPNLSSGTCELSISWTWRTLE